MARHAGAAGDNAAVASRRCPLAGPLRLAKLEKVEGFMKAFITGGAGFIGSNLAARLQDQGYRPVVIDNLSRRGSHKNLEWLDSRGPLIFMDVDLRDPEAVTRALGEHGDVQAIFHLSAQVAVTTSVRDPRHDFENNAFATLNLLEAARELTPSVPFIYSSTNKVYGALEDLAVEDRGNRYVLRDLPGGVSERRHLDFHSPYGCSKGAGDQYVVDYSRIYGLPTVCLRQSCIYGERQMGIEDQGWVAWFTIAHVLDKPITIYGDGKQIRDVLHVKDLCRVYEAAMQNQETAIGQAFNIGGGPQNTLSLRELLAFLKQFLGKQSPLSWDDWRPGDQPVFVCDLTKVRDKLGWQPEIGVQKGVKDLAAWVSENPELFDWLK